MAKQSHQAFATPAVLRAWLEKNHAGASELHVLFHRVHTGTPSITWPESVAEALCFGWIDGIRRSVDGDRYVVRFTPRRRGSRWSAINIKLVAELEVAGRMRPAGRAAFAARPDPGSEGYRAQKKDAQLDAARLREFRRHKEAWAFFEAQPPGYRRAAMWWVMQAKQEATRDRRLARLVELSGAGKRLR